MLFNRAPVDIDEIRRANMRAIENECGGPAGAAARVGMSLAQFANLRDGAKDSKTGKPRGMRKETARRIEGAAGKPPGWLDVVHDASAPTLTLVPAPLPPAVSTYGQSAPESVGSTLQRLGSVLERADDRTRRAVAKLLGEYAEDPSQSAAIADAIGVLLKPFEDVRPV